ncbi:FliH/SctL family protein [Desulfonatronovibrio hydrogenovorans]|uniref:FliH/SctL family protein n=1 Tax=Desulfonatronovibrio hydrogenovorans TaxID=53245 RepID=UPI00048C91CB|nr:FliH/SctL family protein [Desulfonatronovibrio hydrogenovorans]
MSLSDASPKFKGGRVIIGLQSRALDEMDLEARNSIRLATPETEEKFLERVRERAGQKASEIISKAMAEAKEIKQKASEQGFEQGLSKSRREIDTVKESLSKDVARIFANLKQEKHKIWTRYRQDMVLVLRTSLERILGIEIEKNRAEILGILMDQALELVERGKELSLTVSPKDQELIEELMERAREKHPDIGNCRVKVSEKIKKGGLILENGSGVADNTLDSRYKQVKEIVDRISLDEDES